MDIEPGPDGKPITQEALLDMMEKDKSKELEASVLAKRRDRVQGTHKDDKGLLMSKMQITAKTAKDKERVYDEVKREGSFEELWTFNKSRRMGFRKSDGSEALVRAIKEKYPSSQYAIATLNGVLGVKIYDTAKGKFRFTEGVANETEFSGELEHLGDENDANHRKAAVLAARGTPSGNGSVGGNGGESDGVDEEESEEEEAAGDDDDACGKQAEEDESEEEEQLHMEIANQAAKASKAMSAASTTCSSGSGESRLQRLQAQRKRGSQVSFPERPERSTTASSKRGRRGDHESDDGDGDGHVTKAQVGGAGESEQPRKGKAGRRSAAEWLLDGAKKCMSKADTEWHWEAHYDKRFQQAAFSGTAGILPRLITYGRKLGQESREDCVAYSDEVFLKHSALESRQSFFDKWNTFERFAEWSARPVAEDSDAYSYRLH